MKILFISHSAVRSGAPLMLLNMLKWLKENTDLSFEILLRYPGTLQEEFAALAPTSLYVAPDNSSLVNRALKKLVRNGTLRKLQHKKMIQRYCSSRIDLIYSNTITNGDILTTLSPLGCPVITHVHELEGWIQESGSENLSQVKKATSYFIAASEASKRNLVEKHGLSSEKVAVVHSFISIPKTVPGPEVTARIRGELNIPADAFVVLGSGHETWRKGKDLFVQIAARLCKSRMGPQVHFLWVGGWQNPQHKRDILYDINALGISDCVHFTGEVQNPLDYFSVGNLFALVSREDTFPLVCLEAASLGKPILCFADAGGMPEFVEEDAGFVVPYLDLAAMTDRIATLANDRFLRSSLGESAAQKVRKQYDIAAGAERIEKIIDDCLKDRN